MLTPPWHSQVGTPAGPKLPSVTGGLTSDYASPAWRCLAQDKNTRSKLVIISSKPVLKNSIQPRKDVSFLFWGMMRQQEEMYAGWALFT